MTTTIERNLAKELGIDLDAVMIWAEQAQDAYDDDNNLTEAGIAAVREQTASERSTLTITVDMEADLTEAGALPDYDDYDGDYDACDAARAKIVEPMKAAWITAAIRIGMERGYHVDAIATKDQSIEWTSTPDEDSLDTIERQIWQAAHDAI